MSSSVLDYWHARLLNWALYRLSGDSCAISSAYDGFFGDGAPRPPPPLIGEGSDTDALIWKLGDDHRQAVIAVYVWSVPSSNEARAAVLGWPLSTMLDRVRQAKFRLDDLYQSRKHACAMVRARMAA